jgi:hypothetical protein
LRPEDLYSLIKKVKRHEIFTNIVESACETSRAVLPRFSINQKINTPGDTLKMASLLDEQKVFAIDYFSGVLENTKKIKRTIGSLHTSLIVGKRWNQEKNSCEFLVRNSYGLSCDGYDPSLSCDKGSIWMPEKTLKKAYLIMTWLR